RDMSLINTPPVSRTPVQVRVGEWQEDLVSSAIRHELGRGGQVYYVSNRVRSIDDAVARVLATAPEAQVGVAHGQMRPKQLEDIMERFAAGEYDVLVATTIIESGLDNPHTNTLIIEDSQRLGLAQLYQLKGRVGRAHAQAYAYFLFPSESQLTEDAIDRLTTIDEFQDLGSGMKVAMRDLEIRGAGSLLGAEQHGNLSAVGFELFVSMINEAVRAAQAGLAESEVAAANAEPELRIDIPQPCLLPEDYLPAVDERVLFYRRLMAAPDLESIAHLEQQLERNYGALPGPARDLVDRRRATLMAARLGITGVNIARKQLVIEGLKLNGEKAAAYKQAGGLYFAKSLKLQYPVQEGLGYYPALLVLLDGLLKDLGPEGGKT
ncbi:MAG: transcription-repair coupling factor, partial [Coriobacteriia bacterium]|nr:transcription-repair coupling factor [Coriobacteriia bacterium]